jgi:hypothetical protein
VGAKASDACEDLVGGLGPDERPWFVVSAVSTKGSIGLPTRRFVTLILLRRSTCQWIQLIEEIMDSGHERVAEKGPASPP